MEDEHVVGSVLLRLVHLLTFAIVLAPVHEYWVSSPS